MRIRLSLRFFMTLLTLATLAPAQSANDKAAAEALYQRGVELTDAGDYEGACKQFEASQQLDPGLGTMLYLADCYERMGKTASAWAMFHEAESIAQGRGDSERARIAKQRANALEPKLAKLWIRVPSDAPPGLQVKRNGSVIPRQSWGLGLPVDAGTHTIEATAPDKLGWSETLTVTGDGSTAEVTIPALEDAPAAAPVEPPAVVPTTASPDADAAAPPPSGSGQRTAAFVVGGVGIAGIVVGSVFGLKAKSKNDDSLDFCRDDNPNLCEPRGVSLRQDAQSAATIATVGMAVGGAALATGIVLYLTAPSPRVGAGLRLETSADARGGDVRLMGTW